MLLLLKVPNSHSVNILLTPYTTYDKLHADNITDGKKNIDVASDKLHSMTQLLGLYYVRCDRQLLYVHTFAPALTWILHNMSVS